MLSIITLLADADRQSLQDMLSGTIFAASEIIACETAEGLEAQLREGEADCLFFDIQRLPADCFRSLFSRREMGERLLRVVACASLEDFHQVEAYMWYPEARFLFLPLEAGPLLFQCYTAAKSSPALEAQPAEVQLEVCQQWGSKFFVEKLWKELMRRPDARQEEWVRYKYRQYGLGRAPEQLCPVMVTLVDWDIDLPERAQMLRLEALYQILRRHSQDPQEDYAFAWMSGSVLWVLNPEERLARDALAAMCRAVIRDVETALGSSTVLLVGETVRLPEMFDMLERLTTLSKASLTAESSVLFLDDSLPPAAELPRTEEVAALAVGGYRSAAKELTVGWLERVAGRQKLDSDQIFRFQMEFLQNLFAALDRAGYSASEVFVRRRVFLDGFDMAGRTFDNLMRWLSNSIDAVCDYCQAQRQSRTLVERAKEYIQEHITSDLSRKAIAAQLLVSESQLSHNFKLNTGMSLSQYVNQCRLEYSKQLLSAGNMSISEIASSLGFSHASYYSGLFSKTFGYTPLKWRNLAQSGEGAGKEMP